MGWLSTKVCWAMAFKVQFSLAHSSPHIEWLRCNGLPLANLRDHPCPVAGTITVSPWAFSKRDSIGQAIELSILDLEGIDCKRQHGFFENSTFIHMLRLLEFCCYNLRMIELFRKDSVSVAANGHAEWPNYNPLPLTPLVSIWNWSFQISIGKYPMSSSGSDQSDPSIPITRFFSNK